jgi:PHS family inorganic phosphate transporter-like MFS transporter
MAAVFAQQGFGQFGAGIIALIVTAGFKDSLETASSYATCTGVCQLAADKMWRVIIGFGAVPGCIALYYRLTIPETPRYTFDVTRDVVQAGADVKAYKAGIHEGIPDEMERIKAIQETKDQLTIPQASYRDFFHHYSKWKYFKVLFGCASSWFVLDVAFYGLGLNTPVILASIGYSSSGNVYERFYNTAVGNLILVCAGAIPGYWFTVAFVDIVGRKPIQFGGFAILTLLFCVIGFDFWNLSTGALFGLYIMAEFFLNFGEFYLVQSSGSYPN